MAAPEVITAFVAESGSSGVMLETRTVPRGVWTGSPSRERSAIRRVRVARRTIGDRGQKPSALDLREILSSGRPSATLTLQAQRAARAAASDRVKNNHGPGHGLRGRGFGGVPREVT